MVTLRPRQARRSDSGLTDGRKDGGEESARGREERGGCLLPRRVDLGGLSLGRGWSVGN